ncbi:PEPxxWA-CTERM sorting domain-containing protein [Sphingomonas tabacisoli]|uniref:PEPxxWA-CTERM sorting domain-containing protein n=1 Tax=Sphingomonas tabacisoli TaxID=2249466 RepID=A0ABW4I0D3_9SPHN
MKIKLVSAALAMCFSCTGYHAQAATIVDAKTIRITGPANDYLQIAELVAKDYNDANVAPTAATSAFSNYPNSDPNYYGPQNLVDGVVDDQDDLYHSAGTGPNEFAQLTFAAPQSLSSLTLFGRVVLATGRNIYNVEIRNAADALLYSGTFDARTAPATVNFDVAGPGVPEPATWAMMLGGFAFAGAASRRRRSAQVRYV